MYCLQVIPARGSSNINVRFTPLASSDVTQEMNCNGYALGYMSLTDKVRFSLKIMPSANINLRWDEFKKCVCISISFHMHFLARFPMFCALLNIFIISFFTRVWDGFISDLVSKWGVCFGVREDFNSGKKYVCISSDSTLHRQMMHVHNITQPYIGKWGMYTISFFISILVNT